MQKTWPTPGIISTPTATLPQKGSLPLWHTAHQATPWTPILTPHRDAFLHHFWGGVAQNSVWGIPKQTKSEWLGENEAEPYSRPAHFLSWVASSGDIVHRPDYTPSHQRSQLGTLHHRIVGISMANGIRHDLSIPRHWAMGFQPWLWLSHHITWSSTYQTIHWCCQHQRCVAFSLASNPEPVQHGCTYQESEVQLA